MVLASFTENIGVTTTDDSNDCQSVTVPLHFLHAYLAGRVPFLQFCRSFEWVDAEGDVQGVNPFFQRARDNFQIASTEITLDGGNMPLITFHFEADKRGI